MRIVIEAFGRRLLDLELLPPVPDGDEVAVPGQDPCSTVSSHAEMADDGVHGPFGFAPVVTAREAGA